MLSTKIYDNDRQMKLALIDGFLSNQIEQNRLIEEGKTRLAIADTDNSRTLAAALIQYICYELSQLEH
ncbi:hypothetical protein [Neobacillus sp. PS2-9]|uniref:hypothetical protein n=1 Tax=Neobacillus sp. PS2-9 TaxID=3070676 RepID=UPI0027E0C940|nr:hypothetical protein [Neobacillus sp. PS2-9]WML56673.1 hypothetical protein RCG25_17285 [Neobacillus sp. PS2-9]